jgi:non-lysosomal glucosylceramidase
MSPVSPGIHHEGQATAVREALTYRGEALRAVALPLGGIGTGSVAMAGDGGLRQWQIVNNVVDQLLGQWWAHVLGLGYVLPEAHVKTAVQNIFKFNRREGFSRADQRPRVYMDERDRGLYICTWPHGGKPEVPTQYSDEVWSGLEYPVACLLLFEGQIEPALTVLADVRERHDGTRRSPWNEVECGDHYVRPMASWTLLEAAAGYQYDAARGSLEFGPRIDPCDFRSFFITGGSWGTFSQEGGCAQLCVDYGELGLRELRLRSDSADATYFCQAKIGPFDYRK